MDSFTAINEKMNQIDSDILECQIQLRDKEIEKAAYENAVFLLKGAKPKPSPKIYEKDETNFKVGASMHRLREILRMKPKRLYRISELVEFMGLNKHKGTILGVDIAGQAKKGVCFIGHSLTKDDPNPIPKGFYGLKEFYHLYEIGNEGEKAVDDDDGDDDDDDEGEEKGYSFRPPGKKPGRLYKARDALLIAKYPMRTVDLLVVCGFKKSDQKAFGNALAKASRQKKGFIKIGHGKYGLIEHEHLY